MPKEIAAWNSHRWVTLVPGIRPLQHLCRQCGRKFVDDAHTGERYAVNGGVIHFDKLSDETTARWLADSCPGKPLQSDEEDLKTRFGTPFDSDGEPGS